MTVLSFSWVIGSTKSNVVKGYKVNDINIGDLVFFDGYYKFNDDVFYTSETVKVLDIDNFIEEAIEDVPIMDKYKKYTLAFIFLIICIIGNVWCYLENGRLLYATTNVVMVMFIIIDVIKRRNIR